MNTVNKGKIFFVSLENIISGDMGFHAEIVGGKKCRFMNRSYQKHFISPESKIDGVEQEKRFKFAFGIFAFLHFSSTANPVISAGRNGKFLIKTVGKF